MKKFQVPQIKVMCIVVEDIITASGDGDTITPPDEF